ncbi:MAG TPA: glycosyltransferase [Casimicrobiaceae bacterium]|nr:glycosyltransferase [Casimicrobiaceae bacterium]
MTADAPIRVAVVFDPASAAQSEIARFLVRNRPANVSITTTAVCADASIPVSDIDAECIVLLDASRVSQLRALLVEATCRSRLVVTFLDEWPTDLERFHECYAAADLVLIADERLWRRLGPLPRARLLPLALDEDTFDVHGAIEHRGQRVVWLLPFASERASFYEPWVPRPEVFVRGTEFETVRLSDHGTAEQRAETFNRAAIAVCASAECEAQRALREAAACGCAIVVTRRANRADMVRDGYDGIVVASDADDMLRGLRLALSQRADLVANMREAIRVRGWRASGADVWRSIVGTGDVQRDVVELGDEVTVFVSTVGTNSLPACLAHLAAQDCRFRLRMIENVAPMSAAFQAMLDGCETPHYVQVDEDMLLNPDAIRRLHASMKGAPGNVALVVAYLHDVHLDMPVQGVKIFRHDIVRRYPFADVQSCELDQIDRMRADGFTYRVMASDEESGANESAAFPFRILGIHGGMHTPRSIYERFRTLELARRKHARRFRHQEAWPGMLLERFLERRDPLDFYALMGMLAGTLAPASAGTREKDFRTYASLPGLDRVIAFMRDVGKDDVAA